MGVLFQVGTLSTFLQGVYDSDFTFKALAKQGDCGLGVMHALDGEVVALDGNFYRIDINGQAHLISSKACTPFALVTHFQKNSSLKLKPISSLLDLNHELDKHLGTKNIFYMMRIEAKLAWIKLRSESCQTPPYHALADTLPNIQNIFELAPSSGTLIATYCPAYSAALTIPGYHYHYIDEARQTGGHVFDLKLISATVSFMPIREFHIALNNTSAFDNAASEANIASALKKFK
jgi:acetolactate decarboxylase